MCAAEGGKKVVQHIVIRDVNGGELQADFVFISVKQVIVPDGEIEQVAGRDTLRIVIIVLGSGCRHFDESGSELRSQAGTGQRQEWGGSHAIAREAGLKLLIGRQRGAGDGIQQADGRLSADCG